MGMSEAAIHELPGTAVRASDGISRLIAEVAAALDAAGSVAEAAEPVSAALRRALALPDLLAGEALESPFGNYHQELLHVDKQRKFSIAALVWLPGHLTPIHDHQCWCCFGVWRGRELEMGYRRDERGVLVPSGRVVRYPGDVEFMEPPGDIHRVLNDDMVPTVSIHIYGVDLSRAGTSIRRCYSVPGQAAGNEGGLPGVPAVEGDTVAVVGGGFSGTMTSVNLLRRGPDNLRVVMFEAAAQPGQGAAYGTKCLSHLLNVPAGGMSAFPDQPGHFVEWCHRTGRDILAGDFVPRSWYGEYLGDLLKEETERYGDRLEIRRERVESLEDYAGAGLMLQTSGGESLAADSVVLAVGSSPERASRLSGKTGAAWPEMIDPWCANALAKIGKDDSVLVIGTGLTFTDLMAELESRGHRGAITAISRRGLLPACHRPADITGRFDAEGFRSGIVRQPMRVSALCRHVRQVVREGAAAGTDWQEVVHALRPLTPALWAALDGPERRRFSRHLRPFWETLRHRVAPATLDAVFRLQDAGCLEIRRGTLMDLRKTEDGKFEALHSHADTPYHRTYDHVINATGFSAQFEMSTNPLLRSLHRQGWIRQDSLGLGIETSSDFRLINLGGSVVSGLYYIGPMLRARYWECTAVPELRLRAAELAECIHAGLAERA